MDWLNFLKVMLIEERGAKDKYEEVFHADFLEGEYERLKRTLSSKD